MDSGFHSEIDKIGKGDIVVEFGERGGVKVMRKRLAVDDEVVDEGGYSTSTVDLTRESEWVGKY